jgi:hypothetical protein
LEFHETVIEKFWFNDSMCAGSESSELDAESGVFNQPNKGRQAE